ncbi:MAG: GspH/FimT family pseudopilin [candidate division WOR-3 bacterium]
MKLKAFTIIELVIVIITVSILAFVSAVAIGNAMKGIQLNNAADKLASDLRYAQTMAQGTGVWYGISIEANPVNQYTIYTTTGTIDTVVQNPAKIGSLFIVNLLNDYRTRISSVEIAGGNKVEFNPLGIPYSDKLESAISSEGVITLVIDSTSKTVRITPNTGRVYIQ